MLIPCRTTVVDPVHVSPIPLLWKIVLEIGASFPNSGSSPGKLTALCGRCSRAFGNLIINLLIKKVLQKPMEGHILVLEDFSTPLQATVAMVLVGLGSGFVTFHSLLKLALQSSSG